MNRTPDVFHELDKVIANYIGNPYCEIAIILCRFVPDILWLFHNKGFQYNWQLPCQVHEIHQVSCSQLDLRSW